MFIGILEGRVNGIVKGRVKVRGTRVECEVEDGIGGLSSSSRDSELVDLSLLGVLVKVKTGQEREEAK